MRNILGRVEKNKFAGERKTSKSFLIQQQTHIYKVKIYFLLLFLETGGAAPLSYLERNQGQEAQEDGQNPKPDNYLALRPAQELEVMMDGCNLKDTLLGQTK
jgi:hypothetical protein